jgi:hypothetical protein
MASREKADEYTFDYVVLAYDDFGYFPPDRVQSVNGNLESRFGSHDIHCRTGDAKYRVRDAGN